MKRRTVKTILCAALLTLAMTATACGGSDDAAKGTDAATEEAAPAEEEAPAEEAAPAEEEAPAEEAAPAEEETPAEEEATDAALASDATLEDYLNALPDVKKQMEDEVAAANQDGMSVTVDVKGNEMIFTYTYEDASQLTDDTPAQLDAVTEAMGSVYEMMAEQMDQAMGVEKTVSITVKYLDPDGKVLSESSFKAQ